MGVVEPLTRTYPAPPRRSLVPPAGRAVVRTVLLNRLCGVADGTIVTIVAPAGYGKTTLLSQWAERDERPLLTIGFTPEDDDADVVGELLRPLVEETGLLALVDDVQLLRSRAAVDTFERMLGCTAPDTTVALRLATGATAATCSPARAGPPGRDRIGRARARGPRRGDSRSTRRSLAAAGGSRGARGTAGRVAGRALPRCALLAEWGSCLDRRRRRPLPRRLPRDGASRGSLVRPAAIRDPDVCVPAADLGSVRLSPGAFRFASDARVARTRGRGSAARQPAAALPLSARGSRSPLRRARALTA